MFVMTVKWSKKTALAIVVIAALILVGIVVFAASRSPSGEASSGEASVTARNEKSRVKYLSQFGWEIETPAVSEDKVVIPRKFNEVFARYNELQKAQGFDLTQYAGLEVETYTYRVTNHDSADEVLAQLYVYKNKVIAADIHSTALDGFITGVKQ